MDDLPLAWFTQPGGLPGRDVPLPIGRPCVTTPPPPAVSLAEMAELAARVRAEQAHNDATITFMAHPHDGDRVQQALQQAAAQTREETGRPARKWKLVLSRHVPRDRVLSWTDKPGDMPPMGITRRPA